MSHRLSSNAALIIPAGTQVVSLIEIKGISGHPVHPAGIVGIVTASPSDHTKAYRVQFPDGYMASLLRHEIIPLREFQTTDRTDQDSMSSPYNLREYVIYSCVIGSRAYGLDHENSDTDRRGIYLPPANLHWSLYGIPEQLENPETQDCYWELQKFIVLALKANPNVLECLYSPLVLYVSDIGRELIDMRKIFLSKLIYQTYSGYVHSQFRKLHQDMRTHGIVKWKHAMHMVRLLLQGIATLRDGYVPVRVQHHRDELLEILRGERPWEEVNRWRLALHRELDAAAIATALPNRLDYELANRFLVNARRRMVFGEDNVYP